MAVFHRTDFGEILPVYEIKISRRGLWGHPLWNLEGQLISPRLCSERSNLISGVDLISGALPFGRFWYTDVPHAIGYPKFCSRSCNAVWFACTMSLTTQSRRKSTRQIQSRTFHRILPNAADSGSVQPRHWSKS